MIDGFAPSCRQKRNRKVGACQRFQLYDFARFARFEGFMSQPVRLPLKSGPLFHLATARVHLFNFRPWKVVPCNFSPLEASPLPVPGPAPGQPPARALPTPCQPLPAPWQSPGSPLPVPCQSPASALPAPCQPPASPLPAPCQPPVSPLPTPCQSPCQSHASPLPVRIQRKVM